MTTIYLANTPLGVRIAVAVVSVIFVLTVIQNITDRFDASWTPHYFLTCIAGYANDFFWYIGYNVGRLCGVFVIIKDQIYEFIKTFIPSLQKVVLPLVEIGFSFIWIINGYFDHMLEFIKAKRDLLMGFYPEVSFDSFLYFSPVLLLALLGLGYLFYKEHIRVEKEYEQARKRK